MPDQLKQKLSPRAWHITQEQGTEPPFSGKYNQFDQPGRYYCICCHNQLFTSNAKFESSCGWPAFSQALANSTREQKDLSHRMVRVEVSCGQCGAHLGHKFDDGPFGTRYCINSAALKFEAE